MTSNSNNPKGVTNADTSFDVGFASNSLARSRVVTNLAAPMLSNTSSTFMRHWVGVEISHLVHPAVINAKLHCPVLLVNKYDE